MLRESFPDEYANVGGRLPKSTSDEHYKTATLSTPGTLNRGFDSDLNSVGGGSTRPSTAAEDPIVRSMYGNELSPREVLQNVAVADVVKSNPVKAAYHELKDKYGSLLERVAELEKLVSVQQQQLLAVEREKQLAADAVTAPPAHIGFRFNQIDTVVNRLGTVFMDRDALIKKQWIAATIINTACRGFNARRRYKRGRNAVARWWRRAAKPLFDKIREHAEYHSELEQRQGQAVINRSTRLLREIMKRWKRITVHNRPENAERLRLATSMMMMRSEQHIRVCFNAWKQCAQGIGSRRNVVANYKARLNQARARIKASGKVDGVVIKETLQKEMHMDATRRIKERHMEYMVRYVFYCWRDVSVNKNHHFLRKALRHRFKTAAKKAFDAWKHFITMVSDQGAAWRVPSRVNFKPSVNMRAVKQFHRRTLLKKCLRALRKYCHPRALVLKHVEASATAVCTRVIRAWRTQAEWSLAAKRLCLQEWRDYSRRLCSVPFQAWYLWVAQRRSKLHGQQILISAFHRRQRTHKVYQIFRLWKHLSIYGKLEGTKSRKDLIHSLEKQNKFAESLEATVEELQDEVEHLTQGLEEQESINHEQIAEQQILHSQLEQYKFALHAAELEIARLQALVDSLSKCYPTTVKRLRDAQDAYFQKKREEKMKDGKRNIGDDSATLETFARKRAHDAFGSGVTVSRKKAEKVEKQKKRSQAGDKTVKSREPSDQRKESQARKPAKDAAGVKADNVVSDQDLAFLRRAKLVMQSLGIVEDGEGSGDAAVVQDAKAAASASKDESGKLNQLDSSLLHFIASGTSTGAAGAASSTASPGATSAAGAADPDSPVPTIKDPKWELDEMTERQNWNEMLQELSLLYPMQHPLNKTAKSSIQMRIAKAKSESRENYNHHVNIFEKEELVPD